MSQEILRLGRTAGLSESAVPGCEDLERRRVQLWLLVLVVALGVPALIVLLGSQLVPALHDILDLRSIRLALAALLVAMLGYVAERERVLRRLERLLVEEQLRAATLLRRVTELDRVLDAARAMNSSLEPWVVLDLILEACCDLLDASAGAVLLGRGGSDGQLDVVQQVDRSGAARRPAAIEREVVIRSMAARRALLSDAAAGGEMHGARRGDVLVAPVELRDEVLGALYLVAGAAREPFDSVDVRTVTVFAEAVAAALGNAERHRSSGTNSPARAGLADGIGDLVLP